MTHWSSLNAQFEELSVGSLSASTKYVLLTYVSRAVCLKWKYKRLFCLFVFLEKSDYILYVFRQTFSLFYDLSRVSSVT